MKDTRRKNVNRTLLADANGQLTIDKVKIAVLMDIRDELQRLNTLLHCANFQRIPFKLDAIRANTARKRERVKKAAP